MKIRDAKPEELAPKPRKVRALTPRQLATQKRDNAIQKLLVSLARAASSFMNTSCAVR